MFFFFFTFCWWRLVPAILRKCHTAYSLQSRTSYWSSIAMEVQIQHKGTQRWISDRKDKTSHPNAAFFSPVFDFKVKCFLTQKRKKKNIMAILRLSWAPPPLLLTSAKASLFVLHSYPAAQESGLSLSLFLSLSLNAQFKLATFTYRFPFLFFLKI